MLQTGSDIGSFTILGLLGRGGMGEVYRARDNRLHREVAIKALPEIFATDPELRERFDREAQVLASLNHPNIATIHDILEHNGAHYLVMELVEGESLRDRLAQGSIPVDDVIELFRQMAEGLAVAHAAGVVHRDLKPDNVMCEGTRLKILDFGLAKDVRSPQGEVLSNSPTVPMSPGSLTGAGVVMGTPMYMSPEQARAKPVDHLTDVWSFGCCLYEALTGKMAFQGDTAADIIGALLHRDPDLSELPKDTPKALRDLLTGCLQKEQSARIQTMHEIVDILVGMQSSTAGSGSRAVLVLAGVAVVAAVAFAVLMGSRGPAPATETQRAVQQAREELPAKILLAIDEGEMVEAFAMVEELESVAPDHPMLEDLYSRTSHEVPVSSEPPGATVYKARYHEPDNWIEVGSTPFGLRAALQTTFRLRFEMDGFVPIETGRRMHALQNFPGAYSQDVHVMLQSEDSEYRDMVHLAGRDFSMPITEFIPLQENFVGEYYVDLYEVTNADFKDFVDAGGYTNAEWWVEPIVRDGKTLTLAEASQYFVDRVGRPGPAGWELGDYPEGQEDYPVTGISWYEAAAYAAFRGKSLPTVYHWANATFDVFEAGRPLGPELLKISNLNSDGLLPVGVSNAVSSSGAHDLTGNAREWCTNMGRRGYYTMGGSWADAPYIMMQAVDTDAWERSGEVGFRCVVYVEPPNETQRDRILLPTFDFYSIQPMPDAAFETLLSQSGYDKRPFEPVVESTDDSNRHFIHEVVTINSAHNDRMLLDIILPKGVDGPIPFGILFPGMDSAAGITNLGTYSEYFDFMARSGRAMILPHYEGLLEEADGDTIRRLTNPTTSPEMLRDWVQDIDRTLAYAETREDLRSDDPVFLGLSLGTIMGSYLLAYHEDAFASAILVSGGFTVPTQATFASHVTTPFLMLNGDSDYLFPVDSKQKPMFELTATPIEHKKHVVIEGSSHIPDKTVVARESLLWLEKYQPLDPDAVPVE